jgi:hypothetical protein
LKLGFNHAQARTFYVSQLSGGLRNDTTDDLLENRQRWRLADVRLEEYCFVVLSRLVNALEEQVGQQLIRHSLIRIVSMQGAGPPQIPWKRELLCILD